MSRPRERESGGKPSAEPSRRRRRVKVRNTRPEDIAEIIALSKRVYEDMPPWHVANLEQHLEVFPEGQFVAVCPETGRIIGMAASLIVDWDDYDVDMTWRELTDGGRFTNHDPDGLTLYGAEVMVDPNVQGGGVGSAIYRARRDLCRRLGLKRIRAGARLPGYDDHAHEMDANTYVERVIAKKLRDPTLSFQLRQGFRVVAVTEGYLPFDHESHGWAAVIEWRNPDFVEAAPGRLGVSGLPAPEVPAGRTPKPPNDSADASRSV
jgi:GNAT superfamily N-acetyltransferase